MEVHRAFLIVIVVSCFAIASYAQNAHLSSLNQTLTVSTSSTPDQALKVGVDSITIAWAYNTTLTATEPDTNNYTTVEVKLCYAPVSQTGRDDRKTDDNLDNDKTCPIYITDGPYQRSNNSFIWTIPKDTPNATYFVRVYVLNANKHEIAYGQSTDALKDTNLLQIDGVDDDEIPSAAWPVIENICFRVSTCIASYVILRLT
ncbi:high-affinity nitrate transporter 3.1-like [Rutidosis leptorrhynchoides]|uniref:high-affinity nitrate transporter 3.1-like n=1 Tax=Rutidosis leptorrhynchoides TaxID=125765 RepID=UPI003A9A5FE7